MSVSKDGDGCHDHRANYVHLSWKVLLMENATDVQIYIFRAFIYLAQGHCDMQTRGIEPATFQ